MRYRRTQAGQGSGGIEVGDFTEILCVQVTAHIQAAAGKDGVLDACP
ncbi:MAG: hypothetical protein UCO57_14010 [Gemmiger sp.]|nr:hypothetical protein [Gemmiger sp.]MEE0709877.1 hypothetical protein [Gemmiger sp.]